MVIVGLSLVAGAQNKDNAIVEKYIKDKIKVNVTALDTKITSKFFEGKLYKTKISQDVGNGTSSQGGPVVHVNKGKAINFEEPSTNQEMKILASSLKRNVSLTKEIDILYFEKCLDLLFPISSSFGVRDKAVKEFIVKKNQIIFVRGKFFDKFKAFVVDLDRNKKIKTINYSLEYKK